MYYKSVTIRVLLNERTNAMQIAVDADISSIFREFVYVSTKNKRECQCGFDVMMPARAENFKKLTDASTWRICATCGAELSNHLVSEYNRFNGYAGFDDGESAL